MEIFPQTNQEELQSTVWGLIGVLMLPLPISRKQGSLQFL